MLPSLIPLIIPPGEGPSVPYVEGFLHLGLGVEGAITHRFVTEDELLDWDHPFVNLCEHAIESLRGRTTSLDLASWPGIPGLWQVKTRDGLAATRLLCMDELFDMWPSEGFVVACPSPDRLLVVPLEGVTSIMAIRGLMRILAQPDRVTLSDQLFWLRTADDEWQHVPVRWRADGGLDLQPGSGLVAAIERTIACDWITAPAYA